MRDLQAVAVVLKNQSVSRVLRPAPNFVATTPGKAMFGLIGAAASVHQGNNLVAEHDIVDPARTISAGLLKTLSARHGMQVVEPSAQVASRDPADFVAAANGARYLIDVQTFLWNLRHFTTDWTHYKVMHLAMARLIDTQTMAVLSAGTCKHYPESSDNAPTYDQLVGQNAALLKKTMNDIADACIRQLEEKMLPG